jgi:cyclic beta-1,2-glucan synthetase
MARKHILYFSVVCGLSFISVAVATFVLLRSVAFAPAIVLIGCGIFVFISPALAITNLIFILAERRLLNFSELKLSSNSRAVILVPCLLMSKVVIQGLLDKLIEHYKSTNDDLFGYVLLTDFADADEERCSGDMELLNYAGEGIDALNVEYGNRFVVLHRSREWNPSESKWMGRERKRGKLEDFAAMRVTGDTTPFSAIIGCTRHISSADYAIVLDADTVLPRGTARQLLEEIESLRDDKVDLVQPNIFPTASEPKTMYQWIMSPIFPPLSIYQSVFDESWYAGKAIFKIQSFHEKLSNRLPSNWILSHDTIESCFLKVAASKHSYIEESNPATHLESALRSHRWYRGDWQLLPWLLPRFISRHIAECRDYTATPVSLFARWKLFESLMRGLVPMSLLAWCIGILVLNVSSYWVMLASAIDLLTSALVTLAILFSLRQPDALRRIPSLFARLMVRSAYIFSTLPHYASISFDALCRALVRMFITGRKRLEWMPFSVNRDDGRLSEYYMKMWQCCALGTFVLYKYSMEPALHILAIFGILWIVGPFFAWSTGNCRIDENYQSFVNRAN